MTVVKPKGGEVWKKVFSDEGNDSVYYFVIEEDDKLLGIQFSTGWEPKLLDDVEDGKDGWKRVYEPKHIPATKYK